MKKIVAITTSHKSGYEQYGKKMSITFDRFWPDNCELLYFVEDFIPDVSLKKVQFLNISQFSDKLNQFKQRHKNNRMAHGETRIESEKSDVGLGFRWNAVRFSHKAYVITEAAATIDCDLLIWLDADTFTFKEVPQEFLDNLLDDEYVAYLGRDHLYTETGFLAFNVKHQFNHKFMQKFQDLYNNDTIFELKEWHDCECFDTIRKKMTKQGKIKTKNLNIHDGIVNHPFINSELGDFMDHLKGDSRKSIGTSYKDDLIVEKNNEYWDNNSTYKRRHDHRKLANRVEVMRRRKERLEMNKLLRKYRENKDILEPELVKKIEDYFKIQPQKIQEITIEHAREKREKIRRLMEQRRSEKEKVTIAQQPDIKQVIKETEEIIRINVSKRKR